MTRDRADAPRPGEWAEDRMFGVKRGEPRGRRPMPDDQPPEVVIAEWMMTIFRKTGGLTQKQAIWGISELWGPEYLQSSSHGRATIPRAVLAQFRKLDPAGEIVWSTHQRAWRPRRPDDPPERRNAP